MVTADAPPETSIVARMTVDAEGEVWFDGEILNRSQIARDTGAHLSTISRVFAGIRRPSTNLIFKIAKSMDITMDDLFHWLNVTFPGMYEVALYQERTEDGAATSKTSKGYGPGKKHVPRGTPI